MLPANNLQSLIGATLFGPDQEKIGRISQVFVDASDGHPTGAEVHVGLLGRHAAYAPLRDAVWEDDEVTVPFSRDVVADAPRVDLDGGLTPAQEAELEQYYAAPV